MPRAALSVLVVALALGGCVFGDCQFETARAETVGGLVLADGRGVGDTLTVAFVQANVLLDVTVDEGVGETPDRTPDEVVELLYDAVSRTLSGGRPVQPFAATTRGDTAFVYVAGTLDPVQFACSPPTDGVAVRVREVLVPDGVVAARVTTIDASALSVSTAAALRQSDAGRRAPRTITI